MKNLKNYKKLRTSYSLETKKRPMIFEKFWNDFEINTTLPFNQYRFKLSLLEIKADFCIALDTTIVSTPPDTGLDDFLSVLNSNFRACLQKDWTNKIGLRETMRRDLTQRRRSKEGNDIPKGNLSNLRLLWGLDAIQKHRRLTNNDPLNTTNSRLNNTEMEFTKKELETFVKERFSEEDWDKWESRFVWGESLRNIAEFYNQSHVWIRFKTNQIQEAIKEHYEYPGKKI